MEDQQLPRSARRAAKIDYTEKREDEEAFNQQITTPNSPEKSSKRKPAKKNGSAGGLTGGSSARPDTPDDFPLNMQPAVGTRFPELLDVGAAEVVDGRKLVLDELVLRKGDTIYLVCEPPGEPYYIGCIMGFSRKKTDGPVQHTEPAENYLFKINWFYRARDIQKHTADSRQIYASMHSDTCPLHSFRGVCTVKHRDEIADFDQYKLSPNNFWFDSLFDRYMIRFYDVIPTSTLSNLPTHYFQALKKRFQYIFVETGKAKDMLQSPKSCAKCQQWCNPSESVECCECHELYHMLCLDPPLLKKPARGFAWSCISCTKKLETQKLIPGEVSDVEEEVVKDVKIPIYEELAQQFLIKDKDLTQEERRDKEEWNYRYLGMHAKLEDALDLQDRPYARAASRLGSKHQLTGIQDWTGHRVQYYDHSDLSEEFQKKYPSVAASNPRKSGTKAKKKRAIDIVPEQPVLRLPQQYKNVEPCDFPAWLQERPKGYIERGGDETTTLMWKMPTDDGQGEQDFDKQLQDYLHQCEKFATALKLLPSTPNFMDRVLKNLLDSDYNFEKAMELNTLITRRSLKEPTFTRTEVQKFEDAVRIYGSELHPVHKLVKSQSSAMIVRFYYLWKKTKNGKLIWGNYEGRKKQKFKAVKNENEQSIANINDDSSYDSSKLTKEKHFECKHCKTLESVQWFRAPGPQFVIDPKTEKEDKSTVMSLCARCARLWRRYAIVWEDPNEVLRKSGQKGGNGWKKKMEYELVLDAELILRARADSLGEALDFTPVNTQVLQKIDDNKKKNGDSSESNNRRKRKSPAPVPTVEVKKSKSDKPAKEKDVRKKEKPVVKQREERLVLKKGKDKEEKPEVKDKEVKPAKPQSKKSMTSSIITWAESAPEAQTSVPYGSKQSGTENINPETVVSHILHETPGQSLARDINRRYHEITSPIHNARTRYKELPIQKSPFITKSSNKVVKPVTRNKNCCVCLVNTVLDALVCYQCGMYAHPECYGVKPHEIGKTGLSSFKWFCDPCSNQLNPICSTDYRCVLCGQGGEESVQFGLKRTREGNWVHLICAIFNDDNVTITNSSLQPVLNTSTTVMKDVVQEKQQKLINCHLCDYKISIDSLNKFVYNENIGLVGFKFIVDDKPDIKSIKVDNHYGKILPFITCSNHSYEEIGKYLPLTMKGKRYKQPGVFPLIVLYFEDKGLLKNDGKLSGLQKSFKENCELLGMINSGEDRGVKEEKSVPKCSRCSTEKSIKWFDRDGLCLCFNCHFDGRDKDMEDVDTTEEEEEEEKADYLKLLDAYNQPLSGAKYGIEDEFDYIERLPDSNFPKFQAPPPYIAQQTLLLSESLEPTTPGLKYVPPSKSLLVSKLRIPQFTGKMDDPKMKMSIGNILG